jgi:hypothetical protein
MINYYDLLEIPTTSSLKEIKKAFRKKLKQYHPDLFGNKGDDEKNHAEKLTKLLNEAYSVLSDKIKKKSYDEKYKYRHNEEESSVEKDKQEWDYSFFYKEYAKLKKLYHIPEDKQADNIVYSIFEKSKLRIPVDYFLWPKTMPYAMPIKYFFLTDLSSELFSELQEPYLKAVFMFDKCMELMHYDKIMSHIDECIQWGGKEKKKYIQAEINTFFIYHNIRVRLVELKKIFRIKINKILLGITDDDEHNAYAINYLSKQKSFRDVLDYTKFIYNGQIYGKRILVRTVVSEHIRLNPKITTEILKNSFELDIKDFNKVFTKDYDRESYANDDRMLCLGNGVKIWLPYIYTISDITNFIKNANNLGYNIREFKPEHTI